MVEPLRESSKDFLGRLAAPSQTYPPGCRQYVYSQMVDNQPSTSMSRTLQIGTTAQVVSPEQPGSRTPTCDEGLQRFVVTPGTWLNRWMLFNIFIVFVTAYYEPYAVAVVNKEPRWGVVLCRFLDLVFTVDLFMQFFIARPHAVASSYVELYERNPSRIALMYCAVPFVTSPTRECGWFWVDLMTVVPGWVVILSPRISTASNNPFALLRILRLFRLTKMGSSGLGKTLNQVQAVYGVPAFLVEIGKFAFITSLTCHWMACVWCMVEGKVSRGLISYRTDQESTWLTELIAAKGDCCVPRAEENPFCVYVLALYWAAMTLTTVGYGDISPQNIFEYGVCTLSMIIISYVWAYIIAKIVALLGSIDPHEMERKQKMDQLNVFMRQRGLPWRMRRRLREYMFAASEVQLSERHRCLMEEHLSEGLQREVAGFDIIVRHITDQVLWARDLEPNALFDLVRNLHSALYGPAEEVVMRQTILIFRTGVTAVKGRVLTRGDVWGAYDILLETEALIDPSVPRTLSFVELLWLDKQTLRGLCRQFPRADHRLRRAQIRTAVCRAFVMLAKVTRQSRAVGSTTTTRCPALTTITSFVNPGENRLQLNKTSVARVEEVTLADVKTLLRSILKEQEAIRRRLPPSVNFDFDNAIHNRRSDGLDSRASSEDLAVRKTNDSEPPLSVASASADAAVHLTSSVTEAPMPRTDSTIAHAPSSVLTPHTRRPPHQWEGGQIHTSRLPWLPEKW